MKITWIEHSSFLLELPERVLVLDYFGKTRLPLPANKPDRKSTRLNSSHITRSRMPSSA